MQSLSKKISKNINLTLTSVLMGTTAFYFPRKYQIIKTSKIKPNIDLAVLDFQQSLNNTCPKAKNV